MSTDEYLWRCVSAISQLSVKKKAGLTKLTISTRHTNEKLLHPPRVSAVMPRSVLPCNSHRLPCPPTQLNHLQRSSLTLGSHLVMNLRQALYGPPSKYYFPLQLFNTGKHAGPARIVFPPSVALAVTPVQSDPTGGQIKILQVQICIL